MSAAEPSSAAPGGGSMGRGLAALLTDLLADIANRSLDLDPASRQRLAALDGRSVRLDTVTPPLGTRSLTLTIVDGRLRLLPDGAERPNVIVRGTPADLLAWLGGRETADSKLTIDGDVAVLGELRGALSAFKPDLSQPLGRLAGDGLAQTALGTAELAFAAVRSALQGAGHAARAGVHGSFVDRQSLDRLLDELGDLQLRVDRLAARVRAREHTEPPP